MKYILLVIPALYLAACSGTRTQPLKPSFKIDFAPAFSTGSSFAVYDGPSPSIDMTVLTRNQEDSVTKRNIRSFSITEAELQSLTRGAELFKQAYPGISRNSGFNDIQVRLTSTTGTEGKHIEFDSPWREVQAECYLIIDPLFLILKSHIKKGPEAKYLKDLEQYFDPIPQPSPGPAQKPYAKLFFEPTDTSRPLFLFLSLFEIYDGPTPSIRFAVLKRNAMETAKARYNRSFALTQAELESLKRGMELFTQAHKNDQNTSGPDGMWVKVISSKLTSWTDTIDFWSPARFESQYYYILDPFISVLRNHLFEEPEAKDLDSLEQYFDFNFPIRQVTPKPVNYEIYGTLPDDDESTQKVDDFIFFVPADEPVTIDMTNFKSMSEKLYPSFRRLHEQCPQIKWLANPHAYTHLLKIGIPESDIQKDWK